MKSTKLKDLSLTQLREIADAYFFQAIFYGKMGDAYTNHVAMHTIRAVRDQYGQAFVGVSSHSAHIRGFPIVYEWNGEALQPFSVDFVVPVADPILLGMIGRQASRLPVDFQHPEDLEDFVEEYFDIIRQVAILGGVMLTWSAPASIAGLFEAAFTG